MAFTLAQASAKVNKAPIFRWNQSEHDNGRRDYFLLHLTLSLPLIKKQPFKSTVIYSSTLSLTEIVSVQSAFTESSAEKSLPFLPQRTDILSTLW